MAIQFFTDGIDEVDFDLLAWQIVEGKTAVFKTNKGWYAFENIENPYNLLYEEDVLYLMLGELRPYYMDKEKYSFGHSMDKPLDEEYIFRKPVWFRNTYDKPQFSTKILSYGFLAGEYVVSQEDIEDWIDEKYWEAMTKEEQMKWVESEVQKSLTMYNEYLQGLVYGIYYYKIAPELVQLMERVGLDKVRRNYLIEEPTEVECFQIATLNTYSVFREEAGSDLRYRVQELFEE